MKDFLFHPPLVHFPIAFYFLELVLLMFWLGKKDAAYRRFALFVFRLGFLFMIAAAVTGYLDASGRFPPPTPVRPHFYAALSVFGTYTLRALLWRFVTERQRFYRLTHVLGALVGNALVAFTAYLGGGLVFG